jgi:phage terminase large subunit-like protein
MRQPNAKVEAAAFTLARRDYIRDQVLNHGRLDILCEEVLGYNLQPFHKKLQRFALRTRESLQLAFRGGGKSTTITISMSVFYILRNPNIRILIASKTIGFAKGVLGEIKGHLEKNEDLIAIFGPQVGDLKWGESEIIVAGRTKVAKEATITTVGVGGQTVGRHYDVIFGDDLVDQSNSQTEHMREATRIFYYKTLMPTLEPGGELHLVGTRYHWQDLYGHLQRNEMAETTQIIPVLNGEGKTPWPEKFDAAQIQKKKKAMGLPIFVTQMQCDATQMKGDIFDIDYMPEVELSDVPKDAKYYLGVDVSTGESNDFFAIVCIAVRGSKVWVVDHFEGKLRFSDQAKKIHDWADKYDPIKVGIEINVYQVVLAQTIEEKWPWIVVKRIRTRDNKERRAIRLAARHEEGEFRYVTGNQALISHLLLIPAGENDDLFDALDHAYRTGVSKRRRGNRSRKVDLI